MKLLGELLSAIIIALILVIMFKGDELICEISTQNKAVFRTLCDDIAVDDIFITVFRKKIINGFQGADVANIPQLDIPTLPVP